MRKDFRKKLTALSIATVVTFGSVGIALAANNAGSGVNATASASASAIPGGNQGGSSSGGSYGGSAPAASTLTATGDITLGSAALTAEEKKALDTKVEEAVKNSKSLAIVAKDGKLSPDVFKAVEGKDVVLKIVVADGLTWNINAKDLKAPAAPINFSVKVNSNAIDAKEVENFAKEAGITATDKTVQLSLSHDGAFGFDAKLSFDLSKLNITTDKKNATLLFYSPSSKKFIPSATCKVVNNAITFDFKHASDYVIVFSDNFVATKDLLEKSVVNGANFGEAKEINFYCGGTAANHKFVKTVLPEVLKDAVADGTAKVKYTYKSDNKNVLSVTKRGGMWAKTKGTANVTTTVTVGNVSASYTTQVSVEPASIKFVKGSNSVKVGSKTAYKVALKGYKKADIVWASSNSKIASVSKNTGKSYTYVTAKKAGKVNVVAKVLGKDGKYKKVKYTVKVK